MTTNRHYRWLLAGAVIILWLAFGLRLYHLNTQSIWWDEGHSIFVASHPLSQIPTLPAMDVHPPAYFALLNVWLVLTGYSQFALRFQSVTFGLLTVALLWRFARHLSSGWAALLAGLFAAISPLYVAYSQEVRSYTMITFLALGSTFYLWRVVQSSQVAGAQSRSDAELQGNRVAREQGRKVVAMQSFSKNLAAYIFFTAACLYTHYFTIFLLLFQNAIWLTFSLRPAPYAYLPTPKKLTLWFGSQAAILILFAPQLALAVRQVSNYANPNLLPPALTQFLGRSWQAYTAGLTIDPTPGLWAAVAIAVAIIIAWGIIFFGQKKFIRVYPAVSGIHHSQLIIRNFLFFLAWLFIPLTAYFMVLQQRPSFEPRYLMLVSPAIFLLLAVGLGELRMVDTAGQTLANCATRNTHYLLRFTFYVLTGITLAALLTGLYSYFTNETYFKDDSAGVARWLAAETTANDIVFVDVPHPFHYYAERIPAPTRYLFVDVHTAANTLNAQATERDRLYWVTWYGSDTDPRGVIPFLAEKAGLLAGQRDFKGYQVRWYNLPSDATFSLPADLPPADATFGDVLRLDGAAFSNSVAPGQPVWATLHFSLLRETDTNYKVSLRLRNEAGEVVTQLDRDLLNDRHFRTAAWPLNDPALNQAINVYLRHLPPDVPPGVYQLEVVVYNAAPPYPAEGVTGQATGAGAAALLGTVTVTGE